MLTVPSDISPAGGISLWLYYDVIGPCYQPASTLTPSIPPPRQYNEFLRPTLLVGLFAPPEDISAAVMLETLEFYALGHQNK
jgi:hypothetical protein